MDKIIYSIYKTQDDKFLVEDKKDGKAYKFNRYSEIIDACPNPNGFQFSDSEQGTIPSNPKCKIDVHEIISPKKHKNDSEIINKYCWSIEGRRPCIKEFIGIASLLESILSYTERNGLQWLR